jgi:hypothetical protein
VPPDPSVLALVRRSGCTPAEPYPPPRLNSFYPLDNSAYHRRANISFRIGGAKSGGARAVTAVANTAAL